MTTDRPDDLTDAFADFGRALGEALTGIALHVAASAALTACFDEEDDARAAEALDGLTAEQLRDVHTAANRLAEQADARHATLTAEGTDQ